MKTRKFFKRSIAMLFALVLTFCALAPTVKVQAMEASTLNLMELRYITGDGVRLHKEPNPDSITVGLMYKGDKVNYYTDEHGTGDYENYVKVTREAEPKSGYVNNIYTSRTNPLG